MVGSHRWESVIRQARLVIRRYRDGRTRDLQDDMVQESAVLAWQWSDKLCDPSRLDAAVRTITRRQRSRSLMAARKRGWLSYVAIGEPGVHEPTSCHEEEATLTIDGRAVSVSWARHHLSRALGRLSGLDKQLLMGFYEGFCCAELASRYGRTEDCVKTRLHRARQRIRVVYEGLVRSSSGVDGPDIPDPGSESEQLKEDR